LKPFRTIHRTGKKKMRTRTHVTRVVRDSRADRVDLIELVGLVGLVEVVVLGLFIGFLLP
jgi:hypothetical protein